MSDLKFNSKQVSIINKSNPEIDLSYIESLLQDSDAASLSEEDLSIYLKVTNELYRSGYPFISDHEYDSLTSKLAELNPNHPFLTSVESEVLVGSKTVALPQKMLSTDKAFSFSEVKEWVDRILKAADKLEIKHSDVEIRVTPKLDGFAAYDDGQTLYTRGNGVRGKDITQIFNRGLQVAKGGRRGLGPGEIIIQKGYFEETLSPYFENSRNTVAAFIAEKKADKNVQKAIDDGACVFYPFQLIENWTGIYEELLSDFDSIVENVRNSVEYDIDGIILESTDERIKSHLGATRKFHRWQLAFKVNDEAAKVEVLNVIPQTSRTGRVSPVAELTPTNLSGATISRVTVHHYKMVKTNGIGPGAVVKLVRSGLVIPKIEEVLTKTKPQIPDSCPSCQSELTWSGDHLQCTNLSCPARKENTIIHFFKTLGNADGFGPKVIEKLHLCGVDHVHQVYQLTENRLSQFGFGEKTSRNLVSQLQVSRAIEIEDWRFLAAFGVAKLGGGNGEKLLQHHSLVDLFDLTVDQMIEIDGFGELSAKAINEGLKGIREEFFKVYDLGFNLAQTPKAPELDSSASPIAGKTIVFTGKMVQSSRGDMEKRARALGAKTAKSVTSKTDFLVAGLKVGANKTNDAQKHGVNVLTEDEYLDLIS